MANLSTLIALISVSLTSSVSAQTTKLPQVLITLTGPCVNTRSTAERIYITVINSTGHDIALRQAVGEGQAEADFKITVLDDKGKSIPDTEYGHNAKVLAGGYSLSLYTIPSEQQIAESASINKIFVLTPSHKYVVQAEANLWLPKGKIFVKSKPLTFCTAP